MYPSVRRWNTNWWQAFILFMLGWLFFRMHQLNYLSLPVRLYRLFARKLKLCLGNVRFVTITQQFFRLLIYKIVTKVNSLVFLTASGIL